MLIKRILGSKTSKVAKVANKFLVVFVVSFIFWAIGLNVFVKNIPMEAEDKESQTDAIVILTGGTQRFEEGLKLLAHEKAGKLFVSGVGEDATLPNLLLLSGYVPASISSIAKNIELGYAAKSTKGNAEEVYQWVVGNDIKSIRLVTANYHMARSKIEFDRKMPDIKIIPNPILPDQFRLEKWYLNPVMRKVIISEYNKYLVTKIGFSV
ncbi:MAG: YdcF family protein [Rickettsiales bacterium]|nr:YdcF family protein [Pseudomonadota bacterium]MDA0966814.1 YdcF family protein [Pseudomonadota bacterium]MDG4543486.1 YdcF family protein [Rickettsiales bacterium]MDG4546120.1 YdcF family protein [Rickettsiales bacterium]MDG4547593.1 YdcF family protein [Rickettsiales bacterium]